MSEAAASSGGDGAPSARQICEGVTLFVGDALRVIPSLAFASMQCIVTSPPYLYARDYGL
jgi:hypothetical protein